MKFFAQRSNKSPKIYGYTELSSDFEGLIKIGYTERELMKRMREHYPTKGPKNAEKFKVVFEESSMRNDGTFFTDHDVHRILSNAGIKRVGGEWFKCSIDELKSAVVALKKRTTLDAGRINDFKLRMEQKKAVEMTKYYFENYSEQRSPHFLWNCKMRFGKSFASYKLAQKMGWKKILILTFKPAVENSWMDDLNTHIDFKDWEFLSKSTKSIDEINPKNPFVCFASFQDFLGKNKLGGIKLKNKWAHKINWDCIILDEYHFGAWNDNSKALYEAETSQERKESLGTDIEDWDENISPLKTDHYLYLSGTPFRAIESGEFLEEQIFNWSYSDEQNEKEKWVGDNNPYESLPRMVMMTYKMPESMGQITDTGEFDEFNLNEFFRAKGKEKEARFVHENYVQQWLDLIRGGGIKNLYNSLKMSKEKQYFPFQEASIKNLLTHTLWFLPSIASCYALKNLLMQPGNIFYRDYDIIVCAGNKAGVGKKALDRVRDKMTNPLKTKTITLTCGKLCTGVTVKPWTGIFILRNTSSPEMYFQAAFRVQSSWSIKIEGSLSKEEILKKECYVFDFAPNRALRLVTDISCGLSIDGESTEKKIKEFIKFLPILCFDGTSMRALDANSVLDYGMAGTTGTQLAKKFESLRLIHVDDLTLLRLLENKKATDSLMKIEGFRNINSDLEKIINSTSNIKKLKSTDDEDVTPNIKKKLSEEEKKRTSLRKQIQKKLQKFATRIPIFMYLTDFREETLKDVITKLEPKLFKQVTSLSIEDFDLLLSIGLFNSTHMNQAIFHFRRYEDESLHYHGITKHELTNINVGLFDTKISKDDLIE